MAYVSPFWLRWGIVCSVFALGFVPESSWNCEDRDDVLRDVPADVRTPSACTLDCTARTYRVVLEQQTRLTLRFTDSHAGEADEYCWSTQIKCSPGQRLQSAFILLPVDLSVVNDDGLGLQIDSKTPGATLHQHTEPSLFPLECGLRYDVTQHIAAKKRQENLCVKITVQEQSTLGTGLKCLPYLATTWEK